MLKVVTATEMQDIDRVTIDKYGIAGVVLMERAGLAVFSKIKDVFPEKKVIVICGGGNNGGDGFVIARILHNLGRDVNVFVSAKPQNIKGDAGINCHAAEKFKVKISSINKLLSAYSRIITKDSIIVDAILGTGLSKEVRSPLSDVIKKINKLSCPVVSVDIPSGISSDTGQIMGCAVKAQYTVTFGLPKRGHLIYPGAEYSGELFIEDIGFPAELLRSDKISVNLIQDKDVLTFLPERSKYSHKGTYGHVLIIAGSRGKTGAALMAARACLRTGAGLVTIGVPESLVNSFQSRVTEEMILPLADKGNGTLALNAGDEILNFLDKRGNVLAIGPGLSVDDEIARLVHGIISKSRVPMVIDADGLNAVARKTGILKTAGAPIILTPHPGEMKRLLGGQGETMVDPADIDRNRINIAISFSRKMKAYLVLKGVPTVTATPGGKAFINSTGNPGMASAGTGDVLTGMIAALLAQKLNPREAAVSGVYMHGLIGDMIAEKKGQHSLIASDIIDYIPRVLRSLNSDYL